MKDKYIKKINGRKTLKRRETKRRRKAIMMTIHSNKKRKMAPMERMKIQIEKMLLRKEKRRPEMEMLNRKTKQI